MDKPLFLFVGKSASGKTTIANMLSEKHGYKQVESYTTRPPRFEGESGHIFVSEDEFNNLGELAAYTYYNNHHYGTTLQQLNECDIYVVDIPGVEFLLEKLKDDHRPICIFYFDSSVYNRILRMIDRHDSDMMIISRLLEDEQYDWFKKLDSISWHYNNLIGKHILLYSINVNSSPKAVLELVLYYINSFMGDNVW
jgi:guanylate kinase